jgi:YesN/AraC family two-component response regulator
MNIKDLKEKTKELTLLYVEDNEQLKDVKLEMFNEMFKKVVYAKNGYEGLMKYQEESFDLVITDINMPVMDGLEMVEKIQKIEPSQTVIVLSAYAEIEYLTKLSKLNILSFLTKPVDMRRLLEKIDESTKEKITQLLQSTE